MRPIPNGPTRLRGRRTLRVAVGVWAVAIVVVTLLAPSPAPRAPPSAPLPLLAPIASGHGPALRPAPAAASPHVTGSVVAEVNGYGAPPVLVGVNVTAYRSSCTTTPPSPAGCPIANSTTTNASGDFSLGLANGTYYVAALPDTSLTGGAYPDGFGGTATEVKLNGTASAALRVYPYVPYNNATFVLPNYICYASWVDNHGGNGPGCQNPVLSWTQDGAYYITTANELVFDSFVNGTVDDIAPWTPLYQQFPSYAMIPNELFLTQDGSYIYSWGAVNTSTMTLTAEAVNVTTHRSFFYNFTGVSTNSVDANGQVELTGWDGNDSQLTLIVANGTVYDHDLWKSGQSVVGKLPYFEANNVYWVPYLNGYIDVQADGSSGDHVAELQLRSSTDFTLTTTFSGQWSPTAIVVNGVNGVAFNVSSRELSFQVEWSGVTYATNGSGTLTKLLQVTNYYPPGNPPAYPLAPISESDRPQLVDTGPMLGEGYQGFLNDSWLIDMVPGHLGFYSTNVSPYFYKGTLDGGSDYTWVQWSQEGQFQNASYLIAPTSYECTPNYPNGACTINGRGGASTGTIWWMWKAGLSEFPHPADAPLADLTPPGPTDITAARANATTIALSWTPPAGADSLVNYTVAWGTTTSYTHYASVHAWNSSFTITGLASSSTYDFSVEAWNLHYHGSSAGLSSAVTAFSVTGLGATILNETAVTLTWENPPATFTNLSLDYGTSPEVPVHRSIGTVSNYTLAGLVRGTTYYVAVTPWNGLENGSASLLSFTTPYLIVSSLRATAATITSVSLAWTNPGAPFTNVSLDYGSSPAVPDHLSVRTASSATVTGLTPGTLYYFSVTPWDTTFEGTPRNLTQATPALPGVTGLEVEALRWTSVSLLWTNPSQPFTNLSLRYGLSPSVLTESVSVGTVSSYTVDGLSSGSTYYFEVVPWVEDTAGNASNEVEATLPVPPVVTDLRVGGVGSVTMWLEWADPTVPFTNLALGYGTSPSRLTNVSVGTVSGYTVTGLSPETTYFFSVTAWYEGESGRSSNLTWTTSPLPQVVELEAVASNDTTITVTWSNPLEPFTNLSLDYGTTRAVPTHLSIGNVSNYTLSGLSPGTTYYVAVTPWNGTLSGTTVAIQAATPAEPAGSGGASVGTSGVDLSVLSVVLAGASAAFVLYRDRRSRPPSPPEE